MSVVSRGRVIIDFKNQEHPVWRPLDDRVMGGVSRSRVRTTGRGTVIFEGHVSQQNGGGFASVRAHVGPLDLSGYAGLELGVVGDGKRYRLRLGSDSPADGVVHQAGFQTRAGDRETIRLPFPAFDPVFRGREVPGYPPLDTRNIRRIGLMIVEEREIDFRLELEWIRAYGHPGTQSG